jgi:hypothetical protein
MRKFRTEESPTPCGECECYHNHHLAYYYQCKAGRCLVLFKGETIRLCKDFRRKDGN